MVVSYLYVLEVHTGAIFRVGFFRIVGTFVGAVVAYVVSYAAVSGHGRYTALIPRSLLWLRTRTRMVSSRSQRHRRSR